MFFKFFCLTLALAFIIPNNSEAMHTHDLKLFKSVIQKRFYSTNELKDSKKPLRHSFAKGSAKKQQPLNLPRMDSLYPSQVAKNATESFYRSFLVNSAMRVPSYMITHGLLLKLATNEIAFNREAKISGACPRDG